MRIIKSERGCDQIDQLRKSFEYIRRCDMKAEREKKPTWDPDYVRDLSVTVYRRRLVEAGGADAAERMIEKDEDGGEKLRGRAASYDPLTRAYLKALGFEPPALASTKSNESGMGTTNDN